MGHGLDQQVSRRELLVQQIIILILLVGISFFISAQVSGADRAMDGKTGATGLTGTSGENGVNGQRGSDGATGAQGLNGSDGSTGATGVAGLNGIGIIGATGATGANGTNGLTGAAGTNGTNGSQGATGPIGAMSANFASYYNDSYFSPVNIPSGAHWILEFPTQAASKGTDITINGSSIAISRPGTYLVTASGVVDKPVYEGTTGVLAFDIVLRQSVNGGSSTVVAPSPLAGYNSVLPDMTGNQLTQTYSISRLITVTTATTEFNLVLNNYSYGGAGTVYAFDHMINVVRVD